MVMFAVLINGEFLILWTRGRLNGAYYKDLSVKSRLKQYEIMVNAMILRHCSPVGACMGADISIRWMELAVSGRE